MPKYRDALPQLSGGWFLTDGGIETTLVFDKGIDLPEFASFPLLGDEASRKVLRECVRPYLDLTHKHNAGIIIETLTWRASRDWAQKLGISAAELERLTRAAVDEVVAFREEYEADGRPVVISGNIGPR